MTPIIATIVFGLLVGETSGESRRALTVKMSKVQGESAASLLSSSSSLLSQEDLLPPPPPPVQEDTGVSNKKGAAMGRQLGWTNLRFGGHASSSSAELVESCPVGLVEGLRVAAKSLDCQEALECGYASDQKTCCGEPVEYHKVLCSCASGEIFHCYMADELVCPSCEEDKPKPKAKPEQDVGEIEDLPFLYFSDVNVPSNRPSASSSDSPSYAPSAQPSSNPSGFPSWTPTAKPSSYPSAGPSAEPSGVPSLAPTSAPSAVPSASPTERFVAYVLHTSYDKHYGATPKPTTATPSGKPSRKPSASPSATPSEKPSWSPSGKPSEKPSEAPSLSPSRKPFYFTPMPVFTSQALEHTEAPTNSPSEKPSPSPSREPTLSPSSLPSDRPTASPSGGPSSTPSEEPTRSPSGVPSGQPTASPSEGPSNTPSEEPSLKPSVLLSSVPSSLPSYLPTGAPSEESLESATKRTVNAKGTPAPTAHPTDKPSDAPSLEPSSLPSMDPSVTPSSSTQPSSRPSTSGLPSGGPSGSGLPSMGPSVSAEPTAEPSSLPSEEPSSGPSEQPSAFESKGPSISASPSMVPSDEPSSSPSAKPSLSESEAPSATPSVVPSSLPSNKPSLLGSTEPSPAPSIEPSGFPSMDPSITPTGSGLPSIVPSTVEEPSSLPSDGPTLLESEAPSATPSAQPSDLLSLVPSGEPSTGPSDEPSTGPSDEPSLLGSAGPSATPSTEPSGFPSVAPSSAPTGSGLPSIGPSSFPSEEPSLVASKGPSAAPSGEPSGERSSSPSDGPSTSGSQEPSAAPSMKPSAELSSLPSDEPSLQPSEKPSAIPSVAPTRQPSVVASEMPSEKPSVAPSQSPSKVPSSEPSLSPSISDAPSRTPTPTADPTFSQMPSTWPTGSTVPSIAPSGTPSISAAPSFPPCCPVNRTIPTECEVDILIGLLEIAISSNHKLAAQWLRLAFHDAGTFDQNLGVGGANGCLMTYPPMRGEPENMFLDTPINTLEAVKKNWEMHPDTCLDVSGADIMQFAGFFGALRQVVVSPATEPGLSILKVNTLKTFQWGRLDAEDCDGAWTNNLPGFKLHAEGVPQRCMAAGKEIKEKMMHRNGFTAREACALIGAHTIGLTRATFGPFLAGPWVPNGRDDGTVKGPVFDNSFHDFMINAVNATTVEEFANDISPFNEPFPDWFQVREVGPPPENKILNLNYLDTDMALAFPSMDESQYPNFHEYTKMYEQNNTLFLRDFFKTYEKMSKLGVKDTLHFPSPCDRCSGDAVELTFGQTIDLVRDLGNATAVGESQLQEKQAARGDEIENATTVDVSLANITGPPIVLSVEDQMEIEEVQEQVLIMNADAAAEFLAPVGDEEDEIEIDELLDGSLDTISDETRRRWRRW